MKRIARWARRGLIGGAAFCALGAAMVLGGCNDAQAGALLGAGAGALAGQAIGHSTEATLIGTGVGAAVGYAVGNESDKARHQQQYHPPANYDY